jgi:hypothetical protein
MVSTLERCARQCVIAATQGAEALRRDRRAAALACSAALFVGGCCAWGWAAPVRQLSKLELAARQVFAGCMAGRMLVAAGLVLLYGGLSLGLFAPACLLAGLASSCLRAASEQLMR